MRARKKRKPAGGRASGKTQRPGGQADHTLRTLLVNFLALPQGSWMEIDGRAYMTADAMLLMRAMKARAEALGPRALADVFADLCPSAPRMPDRGVQ